MTNVKQQIERPESTPLYRALIDLVYSDLLPDKVGQSLAHKGDITPLYPELTRHADRIKLLIDRGFIEEVPQEKIIRPQNSIAEDGKE